MKIKAKLFLIFLISGFLLTSSGVYVHFMYSSNIVRKEVYNRVNSVTMAKSELLDFYVKSLEEQVKIVQSKKYMLLYLDDVLNNESSDIEFSKQELVQILEKVKFGNDIFLDIFLLDLNGKIVVSANEEFEESLFENSLYFKNGKSDIYISDVKNSEIFLSGPLFNDGKKIGVVILKIDTSGLKAIVNTVDELTDSSVLKIVNEDRYVIASSVDGDVGKQLFTENVDNCFKHGDKSVDHDHDHDEILLTNSSNEEIIGSHAFNEKMKWCIISEVDQKEIFLMEKSMMIFAVILSLILILLVGIVAIMIGSSFSKPIKKLMKSVGKISEGQLDIKAKLRRKDEIGDLSISIDEMTKKLKLAKYDIDEKVKLQVQSIQDNEVRLEEQQVALMNVLDDVELEKQKTIAERDKISTILLGIGDAVIVLDANENIQVFNKVAETISGFLAEEVIGHKYSDYLKFIYEKTGKINNDFVLTALKDGKVAKMKNHTLLIRKDGSKVPVADSAAPFKDKNGVVIGIVIVFRDVTVEREIDKMKTEFVSVASHQLRTPLTGIKWHLELLLEDDDKLDDLQKESITEAYESNERMIKLVNDLLSVSRIETGKKFIIEREPTDLVKITDDVITENVPLAKKKNIQISKCEDSPKEFVMNVDSGKIFQVFQNFISNAIKYSKDNGLVLIKCLKQDGNLIVSVKDSGIGIPKKDQANIFKKFFRADNASIAQADGNGLGLYIAKAIIEAHGGKMWFESEEGEGTTFYFSLPFDLNSYENNRTKVVKKVTNNKKK